MCLILATIDASTDLTASLNRSDGTTKFPCRGFHVSANFDNLARLPLHVVACVVLYKLKLILGVYCVGVR